MQLIAVMRRPSSAMRPDTSDIYMVNEPVSLIRCFLFVTLFLAFTASSAPNLPESSNETGSLSNSSDRSLYATADFTQAKYYETTKMIQVGTKLLYFTRGPVGLLISEYDTTMQKWVRSAELLTYQPDSGGWYMAKYYTPLALVSLNQFVYIYARFSLNSRVYTYDPEQGLITATTVNPLFKDAEGFTNDYYYCTVRFTVLGSLLYVTARDSNGIRLASVDPVTGTWNIVPVLPQFTDNAIWTQRCYYLTFRVVGQGTSLWFFLRGPFGLNLFSYNTATSAWVLPIITDSEYSDAGGWNSPGFYETFRMIATSSGVYITARKEAGLVSFFYNTSLGSLSSVSLGSYFSDNNRWGSADRYSTLRLISCGGDMIAVLGKGENDIEAIILNTPGSAQWITAAASSTFFASRADSYDIYRYWTLNAVCINNDIYVAGRNLDHIIMQRYSVSGDYWTTLTTVTSQTCHPSCFTCADTTETGCDYCYPNAQLTGPAPSSCVCNSGYYPNPSESTCSLCPDGAYITQTATCDACSVQCLRCVGRATQCTACKSFAELQGTVCVCQPGYYMTASGECQGCHSTCRTCLSTAVSLCLSCYGGAQLTQSVCECAAGYFPQPDAAHCASCATLCASCTSADICAHCASNADLVNGVCVCVEGFYQSETECKACSVGCAACDSEKCTKCAASWFFLQGVCTNTCGDGMVVRDRSCVTSPLEASLAVFPNNTLQLSFSQSLTKTLADSDIEVHASDFDHTEYYPSWQVNDLDPFISFLVELTFEPVPPASTSSVLLTFAETADLRDSSGTQISTSTLTGQLFPFAQTPAVQSTGINTRAAQIAAAVSQGAVAGNAISFVFGGSVVGLFSLLNQLQLITYITFMNVTLPADFRNTLLGLSPNNLIINPFNYVYNASTSQPPQFAQNGGYSSSLFLLNASSFVLAIGAILVSYCGLLALKHVPGLPALNRYCAELLQRYHWAVPLRLWVQAYLDVGVSALVQIYTFSETLSALFNAALAGVSLLAFVITPVLVLYFTYKRGKDMLQRSNPDFTRLWGMLFLEFRPNSYHSVLFYSYYLARRCMYAFLLVVGSPNSAVQLLVSSIMSLMVRFRQILLYLIVYSPYQEPGAQTLAVLSEFFTNATFLNCTLFLWVEAESPTGKVFGEIGMYTIYVGIALNVVVSICDMVHNWVKLVKDYAKAASHATNGHRVLPSSP